MEVWAPGRSLNSLPNGMDLSLLLQLHRGQNGVQKEKGLYEGRAWALRAARAGGSGGFGNCRYLRREQMTKAVCSGRERSRSSCSC